MNKRSFSYLLALPLLLLLFLGGCHKKPQHKTIKRPVHTQLYKMETLKPGVTHSYGNTSYPASYAYQSNDGYWYWYLLIYANNNSYNQSYSYAMTSTPSGSSTSLPSGGRWVRSETKPDSEKEVEEGEEQEALIKEADGKGPLSDQEEALVQTVDGKEALTEVETINPNGTVTVEEENPATGATLEAQPTAADATVPAEIAEPSTVETSTPEISEPSVDTSSPSVDTSSPPSDPSPSSDPGPSSERMIRRFPRPHRGAH